MFYRKMKWSKQFTKMFPLDINTFIMDRIFKDKLVFLQNVFFVDCLKNIFSSINNDT